MTRQDYARSESKNGMTHVPWHELAGDVDPAAEDDYIELRSVGIDVGTTTTHLRLLSAQAARPEGAAPEKLSIVRRSELYRSPIILTPYEDRTALDAEQLEAFVVQCYRTAGIEPDAIDTGAVIITGEACRTENAEALAQSFSERTGEFVCAMAGPNLEATMAAHGSGAVDRSVENDEVILHLDIGGGTTEFASIRGGFVEETASIRIGARVVEITEGGEVLTMRDGVRQLVNGPGFDVEIGGILSVDQRRELAKSLARAIGDVIEGRNADGWGPLMNTEFPEFSTFDVITCSGGVSEYIYGRETSFYNDLGPELGAAIRQEFEGAGYRIEKPAAGIRATISGAAQHGFEASGNAITVSEAAVPSLDNVPIVPFVVDTHDGLAALEAAFIEKLELYDVDAFEAPFAIGLHVHGDLDEGAVETVADAVVAAWQWAGGVSPLIVVSDGGQASRIIKATSGKADAATVAVDNVELNQFGYLDISRSREDTGVPMVSMKSLVF